MVFINLMYKKQSKEIHGDFPYAFTKTLCNIIDEITPSAQEHQGCIFMVEHVLCTYDALGSTSRLQTKLSKWSCEKKQVLIVTLQIESSILEAGLNS